MSDFEQKCPRQYTIIKFESEQILLRYNQNQSIWKYQESSSSNSPIEHPLILKTISFGPGFIYPKQLTTLKNQVERRMKRQNKIYFEENQINNTFKPIVEFFSQGFHYGRLCLEALLFDQKGEIKLKDPRFVAEFKQTFENDLEQLGVVVLETALLLPKSKILSLVKCKKQMVEQLHNAKYSNKFISSVWILLNKIHQLLPLSFIQEMLDSPHLKIILEEIHSLQNFTKPINSTIVLNTSTFPKKPKFNLQVSPRKSVYIPPLNLDATKQKMTNPEKIVRKVELTSKKRSQNENLNQQVHSINKTQIFNLSKILSGKNTTNQVKNKKIQNSSTPNKRRGKTTGREGKKAIN